MVASGSRYVMGVKVWHGFYCPQKVYVAVSRSFEDRILSMGAYHCVQDRSQNESFVVDVDRSRQPLLGPDVRCVR